jgi:hypothetical protein
MTAIRSRPAGRDRGFVAMLLLTAAALVLAGRVLPWAGDSLALLLGLELLGWARAARAEGPLVAGGILTGIGAGILLAAGPLHAAPSHRVGGAFVLALAVGFAVTAALSAWWLRHRQPWAEITAAALGAAGGALLVGVETLADVLGWAVPAGLLVAGVVAVLRWRQASRR